jgi:hypothetical protein
MIKRFKSRLKVKEKLKNSLFLLVEEEILTIQEAHYFNLLIEKKFKIYKKDVKLIK